MRSARAAVIGHPIAHLKSPELHRAAYRWLGVDIDYQAIDVSPAGLSEFVARLRSEQGWCGLSVTMPHKATLQRFLDDVDPVVASLGVLNTVRIREDGALLGSNTDVVGILKALAHGGLQAQTMPASAPALLGGGGTSLAALAALRELGASSVRVYLRDSTKSGMLPAVAERWGMQLSFHPLTELSELQPELLISTLPPRAADRIAATIASPAGFLLDVAYDPWPSELATAWRSAGGTVISGLEMLLYQAVEQVELFSGAVISDRTGLVNVMCDSIGLPRR